MPGSFFVALASPIWHSEMQKVRIKDSITQMVKGSSLQCILICKQYSYKMSLIPQASKRNQIYQMHIHSWVVIRNMEKHTQAKHLPIQHSILAQGEILITSGGSTLMFKHNTRATHPC